VSAGKAVVFPDEIGQPFGDGKSFVSAVQNRFEKSGADILPVEVGNPAALRAE